MVSYCGLSKMGDGRWEGDSGEAKKKKKNVPGYLGLLDVAGVPRVPEFAGLAYEKHVCYIDEL